MKSFLTVVMIVIAMITINSCGYGESLTVQVESSATMNQSCIQDAQNQLSPQWGNASRLERGMAIIDVMLACEEK